MKRVFFIGWLILLAVFIPALTTAQTNEDCEACHSDPKLKTQRQGRTVSLYVDFQRYGASVHKDLECVGCHQDADVKEFPHPENLRTAGTVTQGS